MSLIWATRGRTWGFRFLRSEGREEPLLVYEAAFSSLPDEPEGWSRLEATAEAPAMVALRLLDPQGRRDQSGRVIPHDFVVLQPLADQVGSVADGRRVVWPLVADEYERVWEQPEPPRAAG